MTKYFATVVCAGLMMIGGTARADDAVPLGRFQPHPDGFGALVRSANSIEAAEPGDANDTELTFHGRRWYRGGFGYSVGVWNRGWGYGYGWGGYRPFYATSFYSPFVYTPFVYSYYPRVVTYSHYYGGWGGGYGWCGISGNAPTPAVTLQARPTSPPTEVRPVPPVEATPTIPLTEDDGTLPVSIPATAVKKPSYKYPAYGDKK